MPPGYDYASNQFEYTFTDNDDYEGAEAGLFYKLLLYRKGYYYSAGTIAAYPQLFSNVTFVTALNVVNTDKVSLTPVQRSERYPHYENKTLYVYRGISVNEDYCNAQGNKVGKFAFYEDDNLFNNYENKESVDNQLLTLYSMIDSETGEEVHYSNDYSFNKYYIKEVVVSESEEEVSTWDVFNANSTNKWTRNWSISPHVYYEWSEYAPWPYTHSIGEKRALYFYYSGIKRGVDYYKIFVNQIKSNGWEVDQVHFFGSTGGYNPVVDGNKKQINIFGGTANESKADEYGSFYVQQTREYGRTKATRGHDYYTHILNGKTGAQQQYYWLPKNGNDPVIVPINRMTKFPFFVEDVSVNAADPRYTNNFPEIAERPDGGHVVDFKKGPGSTPMPSISTALDKTNSLQIIVTVSYKLFGDTSAKSIQFYIDYKSRNCHHLYDGSLGNVSVNNNEQLEPQGETDWSKLDSLGDKGTSRFIYVPKIK
jgi:hypothetical protein